MHTCTHFSYLTLFITSKWFIVKQIIMYISHVMRKTVLCKCLNKDTYQLPSNSVVDKRLSFPYMHSTIPLLPININSRLYLSPIAVQCTDMFYVSQPSRIAARLCLWAYETQRILSVHCTSKTNAHIPCTKQTYTNVYTMHRHRHTCITYTH